MIEPNAAEHERDPVGERVRVDAQADPHDSATGSSSSESMRIASAGGFCR
jgi:hypothetical protein